MVLTGYSSNLAVVFDSRTAFRLIAAECKLLMDDRPCSPLFFAEFKKTDSELLNGT